VWGLFWCGLSPWRRGVARPWRTTEHDTCKRRLDVDGLRGNYQRVAMDDVPLPMFQQVE
jgi:hypothetical protein